MSHGTFATIFNCMDGRTQMPVHEWTKEKFDVDYADTINLPGIDKRIHEGNHEDLLRQMAEISAKKHNSKIAIVVGHQHCAGNPVSDEEHLQDIKKSIEVIKSWGLFEQVLGVFVKEENGEWVVEELKSQKLAA